MSDTILELRGVTRTYQTPRGPLEVLKGVDLDIHPGVVIGLVGPSGAGKSSLLHATGLLERPTGGVIRILGQDCGTLNDRERTRIRLQTIGFVYQAHHLLPEFSAVENVAIPARIAGAGRAEALTRATALLEAFGLKHRLHHQPAELSGGEQQRVALARALANSPRLLLADEPTGNLDPMNAEIVFRGIRDLARAAGIAALVATHNREMMFHMDRMMILKNGVLVERD